MKSLIQPLATFALAGATFVLGQNNPPAHQQEIRTRALVILDGDGKEAGRFASLDNITTLSMTPVGQDIVRIAAREKQLDSWLGGPNGGFTLRSSRGAATFEMASDTNIGKDPTTFVLTTADRALDIRGTEPKTIGHFNLRLESEPDRSWFTFGNKHGRYAVQIDPDGVFTESKPKRRESEGGG